MEISAAIIPILFYIGLAVFVVTAIVNLFQVFRFGLVGKAGVTVAIIFIALALSLIGYGFGVVRSYDWNEPVDVPSINVPAGQFQIPQIQIPTTNSVIGS